MSKFCCVQTCPSSQIKGAILHCFPNPRLNRKRFQIWVANIGIKEDDEDYVYRNFKICHVHFENIYCYPGKRLNPIAVPTLHLTGAPQHAASPRTVFMVVDNSQPTSSGSSSSRFIKSITLNKSADSSTQDHNYADTCDMDDSTKTYSLIEQSEIPTLGFFNGCGPMRTYGGKAVGTSGNKKDIPRVLGVPPKLAPKPPVKMTSSIMPICNGITVPNTYKLEAPCTSKPAIIPKIDGYVWTGHVGKQPSSIRELKTLVNTLKSKVKKCETSKKLLKEKLSSSKKTAKDNVMAQICRNMPKTAKTFLLMQLKQATKENGRRFTLKEKILGVSIRETNPRTYSLLSEICVIPKPRTLHTFVQTVPLKPGINECLFTDLKKRVSKMPEEYKFCSLIFDIMPLIPNISYDQSNDEIIGFANDGINKSTDFCNQALVFTIRGIIKKYTQPIVYTFYDNLKSWELSEQIKNVITKLQDTGLKVLSTVCDHAPVNISTLNNLINATRQENEMEGIDCSGEYFEVNNNKIVPIYDTSHILKSVRNNLLSKDLKFVNKGRVYIAKWQHIIDLYNLAPGYKGHRLVPKLTANHVLPNFIPKLKFQYCSQVFSRSVGVTLGYLASCGVLPDECTDTADLLLLFDNIFDSLNGSSVKIENEKIYKTAVTSTSPHHKLWEESLPIIKSMKFIDNYGNTATIPAITALVKTIEGIKTILEILQNSGQTSIFLNNFNQETIENFFSSIKSHALSGVPNATTFQSSYKTLIVSNLSSNCVKMTKENKEITNLVTTLQHYFKVKSENVENETDKTNCIYEDHVSFVPLDLIELISSEVIVDIENAATLAFCSGSILIKCRQIYKKCEICKNNLETVEEEFHRHIQTAVYEKKEWLCYPTKEVFNLFAQTQNIFLTVLSKYANLNKILEYIKLLYTLHIDTSFLNCNLHKELVKKFLIDNSASFHMTNFCKVIDCILVGKKNHVDGNDIMQLAAYQYWENNKAKIRFKKPPRVRYLHATKTPRIKKIKTIL